MDNTIEPSILISRLMTFVFAAALTTCVVMVAALARMFPLEKTQLFFLTTAPKYNTEISLQTSGLNDQNLEDYKENFIKEYIKARNEIIPNAMVMHKKWGTGADGLVHSWSSPDVYLAFQQTQMWNALMHDVPDFEFRCPVEFMGKIAPRGNNRYLVNFRYFCENNAGPELEKDYTILIGLKLVDNIKWAERLKNPLGVEVVEYSVQNGDNDPLNLL